MCLVIVSCHGTVKAVWTGGSGRVPLSCPAPEGFTISPQEAQAIVEKRFGVSKTVMHIYADSRDYYVVSGFFGSDNSKAAKSGVRVNGKTGECNEIK
jgi:hypothetical protein